MVSQSCLCSATHPKLKKHNSCPQVTFFEELSSAGEERTAVWYKGILAMCGYGGTTHSLSLLTYTMGWRKPASPFAVKDFTWDGIWEFLALLLLVKSVYTEHPGNQGRLKPTERAVVRVLTRAWLERDRHHLSGRQLGNTFRMEGAHTLSSFLVFVFRCPHMCVKDRLWQGL